MGDAFTGQPNPIHHIMNTVELDPSNRLPIRIEAAPAFGQGSMPADTEKTFVLLAHLFPIIVWPLKKNSSPAVDAHGNPTTDPNEVASLLPFGGHKGYGLSLINELFAAMIGGSMPTLRGRPLPTPDEKNTPVLSEIK